MKIIPKNKILYKENQLRSHLVHSTKSIPILTKLTSSMDRPYYYLLIDGIKKINTMDDVWTEYEEVKYLSKVLSFFVMKYPSKILFAFYKLEFTSVYLLRRCLKVSNGTWIEKFVDELEDNYFIRKVTKEQDDFETIYNYWKRQFPNSRRKKPPILYTLTEYFKPAISAFSDATQTRYFSRSELSYLYKFQKEYQDYRKLIDARLNKQKEQERQSLGRCINCNALISKEGTRGKDYHMYSPGLVCMTCNRNATKRQISQWIHQQK